MNGRKDNWASMEVLYAQRLSLARIHCPTTGGRPEPPLSAISKARGIQKIEVTLVLRFSRYFLLRVGGLRPSRNTRSPSIFSKFCCQRRKFSPAVKVSSCIKPVGFLACFSLQKVHESFPFFRSILLRDDPIKALLSSGTVTISLVATVHIGLVHAKTRRR